MKILIITMMIVTLGITNLFSQSTTNSSLTGDAPVKYMTSKEKSDIDVYYEYKIWRTLSLQATPNQPLALPLEATQGRKNLGAVIIDALGSNNNPVPSYDYSDFEMEQDVKKSSEILGLINLEKKFEDRCVVFQIDGNNYKVSVTRESPMLTIPKDSLYSYLDKLFTAKTVNTILSEMSNEIFKYDIYEVWFFNKRYSTFRSEIKAICPYVIDKDSKAPIPLGWIPFNQLRRYLVQVPIKLSDYHATSGLNQYSLDAFFTSRLYSGEIIQAENLQGKKLIDYNMTADQIAKQREEIETRLINLEEDIWAY